MVNGGKSCMAGFVLKNTLSDNGGDKTSSIVTYTASNGTVTEFVYDSTMDVMQNIGDGIAYYGANYVEGGAPAAE